MKILSGIVRKLFDIRPEEPGAFGWTSGLMFFILFRQILFVNFAETAFIKRFGYILMRGFPHFLVSLLIVARQQKMNSVKAAPLSHLWVRQPGIQAGNRYLHRAFNGGSSMRDKTLSLLLIFSLFGLSAIAEAKPLSSVFWRVSPGVL